MEQIKEKRNGLRQAYQNIPAAEKAAYCVIVLFAAASLVYCAVTGDTKNIFLCLLVIAAIPTPRLLEWIFQVRFSVGFKIFLLCFVAGGGILGSVFDFYRRFAHFDTVLHLVCGFLMGMVGYVALDVLNRNAAAGISMASRLLSALTFALAAAVVWEFFEYAMDTFLNFDMQCDTVVHSIRSYLVSPSQMAVETIDNITEVTINGVPLDVGGYLDLGHIDTMNDMLSNAAGGILYCVAIRLCGGNPKSWFVRTMVPTVLQRGE